MRLIDADALKNLPFHRLIHTDFGETAVSFEEIDSAPTVPLPDFKEGYKQAIIDGKTNFSRPQGEWLVVGHDGTTYWYRCSICEHEEHDNFTKHYHFCPNCGADMRKGGAENDI